MKKFKVTLTKQTRVIYRDVEVYAEDEDNAIGDAKYLIEYPEERNQQIIVETELDEYISAWAEEY